MAALVRVVLAALVVATAAVSAGDARASHVPIGPDLSAIGWDMLTFDGIPPSEFLGRADGTLEVRATRSSSVLYREVEGARRDASRLTWSWQTVAGLTATDLTKTDGDDRVLALHVVFAEESLMARLKGAMSPFARGRVLTYVWGGGARAAFPHPHMPDGRGWMRIKRTADAETGRWFTESVDLAADYARAFGEPAPPVAYIGVSGDSDDTAGISVGLVRDIHLN